jgi:hypothetical protein
MGREYALALAHLVTVVAYLVIPVTRAGLAVEHDTILYQAFAVVVGAVKAAPAFVFIGYRSPYCTTQSPRSRRRPHLSPHYDGLWALPI